MIPVLVEPYHDLATKLEDDVSLFSVKKSYLSCLAVMYWYKSA